MAGLATGVLAIYVGFFHRDPEYLARVGPPLLGPDGRVTKWMLGVGWAGFGLIAWALWHVGILVRFLSRVRDVRRT